MATTEATRYRVRDSDGNVVDGAHLALDSGGAWKIRIPNPWGDAQHRAWSFTKPDEATARSFAAAAVDQLRTAQADIVARVDGMKALAEQHGGVPVAGD